MADLTATLEIPPIPVPNSNFVQVTLRSGVTGIAQTDEFIVTGYTNVQAVLSAVPIGTAAVGVSVVPNSDGSATTEGDDPGHIAIETSAAATGGVLVTALVDPLDIALPSS